MTQFTEGQQVKLKDEVARQLENTIGTWDNEFKGLIGLIGQLETSRYPDLNDWIFIAPSKRFGVKEDDIEPVQT